MNKEELVIAMQEYMDENPILPYGHENHTNEMYGRIIACAEKFRKDIHRIFSMTVHDTTIRGLTKLILYDLDVHVPSRLKRFKVSFLESVIVNIEIEANSIEQAEDEWRSVEWFNITRVEDGIFDRNSLVIEEM